MEKNAVKIIDLIISQHAEESSFLWLIRDMAVNEPHYSLKDLAKLDLRIDAHIDGLRISGDDGWEICKEELAREEPGEVFTASLLAFESENEERINEVIKVGTQNWELARGIVSAFGWLPYTTLKKYIDKFLTDEIPILRQIGIAASAIHRQNPPQELFLKALNDEDSQLKARAFKAVGELGRIDLLNYIKKNFQNENPLISFSAAWSASVLGDANAPFMMKLILSEVEQKNQERGIKAGFRKMKLPDSNGWLNELKNTEKQMRLAVLGAGAIGDPANILWLIEMMKTDELARVAGESFTMITGVDLAYDDLEGDQPEGFEAGPTENPEDEDVSLDPDEDLPWPDPVLINKWWNANKSKFKNGTRYLIGQPIKKEWLEQVLRNGKQRQRAAAALELAMLNPGQVLFEVRAPGFVQKRILNMRRE